MLNLIVPVIVLCACIKASKDLPPTYIGTAVYDAMFEVYFSKSTFYISILSIFVLSSFEYLTPLLVPYLVALSIIGACFIVCTMCHGRVSSPKLQNCHFTMARLLLTLCVLFGIVAYLCIQILGDFFATIPCARYIRPKRRRVRLGNTDQ